MSISEKTASCYDSGTLTRAIRGELAPQRLETLTRHLEDCPQCRARYEEKLGHDAQRLIGPDNLAVGIDETLEPILERMKTANDWITPRDKGEGRFRVIRKIGQGGMGEIYECYDSKLNRIVALKKIRTDRITPNLLGRLKKEATLQAGLNHAHIVQIYEVGMLAGIPYLAMEYVGGGTLRDRLQERPLAPAVAARLVAKIAEGLHLAHTAGVLHRDLKPANILMTETAESSKPYGEPEPKIADFGLAKLMGETSDLTETTVIVGTPAYLSPEQAANRVEEIGPRSDIYGLGVILFECLTGHPPFNANNAGLLLEMIKALEPVSPRKLVPGISRDLETICLKCLVKEPARRYATAQALAEDLQRYLQGRPITARPAGWLETGWRWCLRNRRLAASLATILAMITLFSGFALRSANYQKHLRRQAELESQRANKSETLARAQRDQAYLYFLDELQNLRSIIIKLDNPVIRLASETAVQELQSRIYTTIEQLAQRVLTDKRLVEEKPEIALATLNIQIVAGRPVGRNQERREAGERLFDILPKAERIEPRIAVESINSVNILANDAIGAGDYNKAFHAWERLRRCFRDQWQSPLVDDKRVLTIYLSSMKGYLVFLKNVQLIDQAIELERELTGLKVP